MLDFFLAIVFLSLQDDQIRWTGLPKKHAEIIYRSDREKDDGGLGVRLAGAIPDDVEFTAQTWWHNYPFE